MLQTVSQDLLPFIPSIINDSIKSGHLPTAFKGVAAGVLSSIRGVIAGCMCNTHTHTCGEWTWTLNLNRLCDAPFLLAYTFRLKFESALKSAVEINTSVELCWNSSCLTSLPRHPYTLGRSWRNPFWIPQSSATNDWYHFSLFFLKSLNVLYYLQSTVTLFHPE